MGVSTPRAATAAESNNNDSFFILLFVSAHAHQPCRCASRCRRPPAGSRSLSRRARAIGGDNSLLSCLIFLLRVLRLIRLSHWHTRIWCPRRTHWRTATCSPCSSARAWSIGGYKTGFGPPLKLMARSSLITRGWWLVTGGDHERRSSSARFFSSPSRWRCVAAICFSIFCCCAARARGLLFAPPEALPPLIVSIK
jgi:hypothetical protein